MQQFYSIQKQYFRIFLEKLQRPCCKKCYKKFFGHFVNKKKSYEFRKI